MADDLLQACQDDLANVSSSHELDQVKSKYLGAKSVIKEKLSELSTLSNEEKVVLGKAIHNIKKQIAVLLSDKKKAITFAEEQSRLKNQRVDTSIPARFQTIGALHPLTKTKRDLLTILSRCGFDYADGPEIESPYYNFTALNTPAYHPAVTSQDTMYISDDTLLRSHTSNVQIRMLELHKPPLRIVSPGRVYRADTPDATHSPCFMQCEGLVVDEQCTLYDLKQTIQYLLESFFQEEIKMRFRPSFFPFTEPSFECDIWFNNQWLEVLGCGMVHPSVLSNVNIDTNKYHGYAFGVGIDRLAMLRYKINDIRLLYEGKIPFLSQFSEGA